MYELTQEMNPNQIIIIRMNGDMKRVKLSERVRPDCELAPWVIDEIKRLELELDLANLEIRRLEDEVMNYISLKGRH